MNAHEEMRRQDGTITWTAAQKDTQRELKEELQHYGYK